MSGTDIATMLGIMLGAFVMTAAAFAIWQERRR